MGPGKYTFELWSPGGVKLLELSGRARNRRISMSRNEAEDIRWSLDLNEFEQYCRLQSTRPSEVLVPGQTEVRVRRGSVYLCGGQITYVEPSITVDAQTLSVRASGFLNLLKSRYTAQRRSFVGVDRTAIARTLIAETQAVPNGDFGITMGPNQATLGVYTRLYQNESIKDCLQEFTQLQTAFDFEFTYDKQFNTYSTLGSVRADIAFQYPGNIRSISAPTDATGIANRIYLLGSGSGDDVANAIQVDSLPSQLNYKVREKNVVLSAILDSGTLADYGQSQLDAWAFPFELPAITVNGNVPPYVTDYHLGDYVPVVLSGYDMLAQVNGLYRIEKIDLAIDDNDDEVVTLTVSR